MSEETVWQDPPAKRPFGRPKVWPDRLAPLKTQPGRWALLATKTHAGTAASTVKLLRNRGLAFPEGMSPDNFEFVGRRLDDGRYGVFGRFIA